LNKHLLRNLWVPLVRIRNAEDIDVALPVVVCDIAAAEGEAAEVTSAVLAAGAEEEAAVVQIVLPVPAGVAGVVLPALRVSAVLPEFRALPVQAVRQVQAVFQVFPVFPVQDLHCL